MAGRIFKSNLGKVLGTLLVIGIAGSTVGYGTFASFTAQTSNANNTFSTGTLTLSNLVTGGTTCLSTGGGNTNTNINTGCSTLISVAGNPGLAPGGSVATGEVTIGNTGSLPIATLKLWADTCGYGDNSSVSQHGTGDPCPKVNISVRNDSTSTCVTTSCSTSAPSSAVTLATFPTTTVSALTAATSLASGNVQTYTFALRLDSSADNTLQGRIATTTFHWQATQ